MGSAANEKKITPKGGSTAFTLRIIFLLLIISIFVGPVTGFALQHCRISSHKAICKNSDPKLRAVPHDIPPTVTGIDLSVNKISKIKASDFKNLPHLKELYLDRNAISHIDTGAFADLISLKMLDLNGNKLGKLEDDLFDGLRNLTELRINSNHIEVVAPACFKSLTSLTFLDISHNGLKELKQVHFILQQLPNLKHLSICRNGLTNFKSQELTNGSLILTSLDVSQNPIEIFQITADIFPHLTRLAIGDTQGKKQIIWDVHNKTFLHQVSSLDVSGIYLAFDDMKTLLESVSSSLTILKMNNITLTLTKYRISQLVNISCTIPTMSKFLLQKNNLTFIHSSLFHLCVNVTELDVGDNKIKTIQDGAFRSIHGLRILTLSKNKLQFVPVAIRNLPTLSELDLSQNHISKLGCNDFANLTKLRNLNLYKNSITILKDCVFKDLIRLEVLKIHNNMISDMRNAFTNLSKLKQLHLNMNKLTVIKCGEFLGLNSLLNLSLHDNQIHTLENGSFLGLRSLINLLLQSNSIQTDGMKDGCLNDLVSLQRLDLGKNHIRYHSSSPLREPPFSHLSHLKTLAMPTQRLRGKSQLPCNILQGLTNLTVFSTRNCQLLSLPKDMFKYTPQLQKLDISSNDFPDLSLDLFSPIQNIKSLYISRIDLQSLDFLIEVNFTKLEFIQARENEFSVINEDVMDSLPSLLYLDIVKNSFSCDCNNVRFIQWAKDSNKTQVYGAYGFKCNHPANLKGMKLLDFDIHSCSVNTEFICFVTTTSTILLFMTGSLTYHFLRWQLTYAYYFFLALLFDTKKKNRQTPYQYDAFVSYNAHDEPWVIEELLPKLEGEQGWKLCLHHRDFEPGKTALSALHFHFVQCFTILWSFVANWRLFPFPVSTVLSWVCYPTGNTALYFHLYSRRCHYGTINLEELMRKRNSVVKFTERFVSSGRQIIDNITDAIYGSRKTICVISRQYLESEWCSREIQVARYCHLTLNTTPTLTHEAEMNLISSSAYTAC